MPPVQVNSIVYFRIHWFIWKYLGAAIQRVRDEHKLPYMVYAMFITVSVNVFYPLHLLLTTFRNANLVDELQNITILTTSVACALKWIIYTFNNQKINEMESLLQKLDARVSGEPERKIFQTFDKKVRFIFGSFVCIYGTAGILAVLSTIYQEGERSLLYPAWFPFDWRHSNFKFYMAITYQYAGVSVLILQNLVTDAFPPMTLCLISGHVEMLCIRLEQIGYDNASTLTENEIELERCVNDQNTLYKLFRTLEGTMSVPILIICSVTAINVCTTATAVLFFDLPLFDRLFYECYLVGLLLEIYPTCYYATCAEIMFDRLPYAAFSSNWIFQSRKYKKNMILFMERSLKETYAVACGLLKVNLGTFFRIIQGAYSLFTLMLTIKK